MKHYTLKTVVLRLFFFLSFLVLSWVLFTLPAIPSVTQCIPHIDKFAHITVFFILTFLWLYLAEVFCFSLWKKMFISTLSVFLWIGYGFLIEWVQENYFIGRSFEIADILADSFGVIIAQNVFILYRITKQKKN